MPTPRKALVSLDATPYYHCVSRCVRRSFLCGFDSLTGKDFEHRRQWIEDKILHLPQVFAIDVCAYAVMSNHYHVVLHVDTDKAQGWDIKEVVERWHTLFKGTVLTQRFAKGEALSSAELEAIELKTELWRKQLCDISWFMRYINEAIARESNKEDQCTGRFWEGRFKSQALLDEQALAACMAYVDLNPVRAKIAKTPESSEHTSIKKRIEDLKNNSTDSSLQPFVGNPRKEMPRGLPFRLKDYLELVDWTGRIIRSDKRGAVSNQLPPILDRINIDPKQWLFLTTRFESNFKSLVGTAHSIKQNLSLFNRTRLPPLLPC